MFPLILLLLVFHQVVGEDTKAAVADKASAKVDIGTEEQVEGRDIGRGYGYGNNGGYDYGRSQGYGGGQGQRYSGSSHGYRDHQDQHRHHVPITIPHIDRNGCRFPSDVVCDAVTPAADPPVTYSRCILSDENKNLWKKPTMTVIVETCLVGSRVLTDFCNDNERLLRAAGLIKSKEDGHENKRYHLSKYSYRLEPCILFTP